MSTAHLEIECSLPRLVVEESQTLPTVNPIGFDKKREEKAQAKQEKTTVRYCSLFYSSKRSQSNKRSPSKKRSQSSKRSLNLKKRLPRPQDSLKSKNDLLNHLV